MIILNRSWKNVSGILREKTSSWRHSVFLKGLTLILRCCVRPGSARVLENYSRHLNGTQPGEPPMTLLDFFGDDFLIMIDESHITIPQIRGMFAGDPFQEDDAC